MTQWQAIRLVAGREVTTRLRSKAFRIVTVVTLVLMVGAVLVAKLLSGGDDAAHVGFVQSGEALAKPFEITADAVGQNVVTSVVPDEAAGKKQVSNGELDALVVGSGDKLTVVVEQKLDPGLQNAFNLLARTEALDAEIRSLGGDPAQVNASVASASVKVDALAPPYNYNNQQLVLGMIAGILIYMSLMINGQSVAQGVVEEKSSRVVEILLSTIKPWELMAGKVAGIGLVGLIQMAIIGAVGAAAGIAAGVLSIPVSATIGTVVWLVVWFLLGFLLYALAFAGAGALVSRQEDVGGVTGPVLMFVILGYVLGISVLPSDPGSTLIEVLSIAPVFAPTLMPMRLAMGGVPAWEAILSVVLVVALIPVMVWLAGRMYRNAVMRMGGRVKLSEAFRAA